MTFTDDQQRTGADYRFRRDGPVMNVAAASPGVVGSAAMTGTDAATYTREREGLSAFVFRRHDEYSS